MSEANPNFRLEVFCDGVFAIALTLLIIDIKSPSPEKIHSTSEFWMALKHTIPSLFSFVLSFTVIFITWVNHHNSVKLVSRSSPSFIYANGFLMLTVVFVPFPTSLVGEYISTDHAAPAVILYDSVLALQAVGWILICRAAAKGHLEKSERSLRQIQKNGRFGYFGAVLYSACAVLAVWIPYTMALITAITWLFWLIYGISIRHVEQTE